MSDINEHALPLAGQYSYLAGGQGLAVRDAGREAVPDHLGGQTLDHPVAPVFGQLAAQDYGGIAGGLARVDLDPAPPDPVAVTPALVDVVVQGLHLASPP